MCIICPNNLENLRDISFFGLGAGDIVAGEVSMDYANGVEVSKCQGYVVTDIGLYTSGSDPMH